MISILPIKEKVLLACKANDMTLTEFAQKMGVTQSAFSQRLKTGKFTQEELSHMAKILNCKYESTWTLPDGTKLE